MTRNKHLTNLSEFPVGPRVTIPADLVRVLQAKRIRKMATIALVSGMVHGASLAAAVQLTVGAPACALNILNLIYDCSFLYKVPNDSRAAIVRLREGNAACHTKAILAAPSPDVLALSICANVTRMFVTVTEMKSPAK